jgi:glutaminase
MDYLFDVILADDLEFDDYNLALSSYPTWKSVYREIKLNYLLEGSKKIQFDIDDIQKYITLDDQHSHQVYLKKVCCSITGMTFVLNNNKIEKLTLKSKVLDTECGRIVKTMMQVGMEVEVSQFLYEKTLNFIIEAPKNAA